MTTPPHPEEIECFRMPMPDGRFSPDKRYEYTYATRKSWEYIPLLRRKDWRYFTTKGFTYAGKWLRSERRGWGDGGDCWEVFEDDLGGGGATKEKIVSWDYDATLCWRECPYAAAVADSALITGETREVIDKMITTDAETKAKEETETDAEADAETKATVEAKAEATATDEWSLIQCIFGNPSKCGVLDNAETTTMEPKYQVHASIAEFWCFITSFFYGSSLLLYLVKEEDWFEEWRAGAGWPSYIHFSIAISVIVMICSAVYHVSLIEVVGCVDCFFASFVFASVTMSVFGIDILTQVGVLLGIGVMNFNAWRYSTRLALIVVGLVYPFAMLSCMRMKKYYGAVVFLLVNIGVACFLMDRMGIAPLHSLWHIFGAGAITLALYHVVVNGAVMMTNVCECESIQ
jgi:hypothetical protein